MKSARLPARAFQPRLPGSQCRQAEEGAALALAFAPARLPLFVKNAGRALGNAVAPVFQHGPMDAHAMTHDPALDCAVVPAPVPAVELVHKLGLVHLHELVLAPVLGRAPELVPELVRVPEPALAPERAHELERVHALSPELVPALEHERAHERVPRPERVPVPATVLECAHGQRLRRPFVGAGLLQPQLAHR